jgi:hypothetical protein
MQSSVCRPTRAPRGGPAVLGYAHTAAAPHQLAYRARVPLLRQIGRGARGTVTIDGGVAWSRTPQFPAHAVRLIRGGSRHSAVSVTASRRRADEFGEGAGRCRREA